MTEHSRPTCRTIAANQLRRAVFTSVAKFCDGGVENDFTFDHTLYTGADPESFSGVDVILNQFEY